MAVILRNNGSQQHLERIKKRTLKPVHFWNHEFGNENTEENSHLHFELERLHVESELSQHKAVDRGTFQKLVTKRKGPGRAWQTGQNKTKQNKKTEMGLGPFLLSELPDCVCATSCRKRIPW